MERSGDSKAAIQLLLEGKRENDNFRYSRRLIRLYEQSGETDALRAELTHLLLDLNCGGMEELHKLKACSTTEQWLADRTRYLAEPGLYNMELMREEKMWNELLQVVTRAKSLYVLDQYEKELHAYQPEALRDAYAEQIRREGEHASNRGHYALLTKYLKKLKSYPNGEAAAAEIAADWRCRFARRRAMLEELKKAGL